MCSSFTCITFVAESCSLKTKKHACHSHAPCHLVKITKLKPLESMMSEGKCDKFFFPIVISHFPHRLLMPVSLIPCALDTSCDCCNILWFINVFIRHDRLSDFCYFSVTSLCSIMNCRGDSSASLRDIMSPPDDVEICY